MNCQAVWDTSFQKLEKSRKGQRIKRPDGRPSGRMKRIMYWKVLAFQNRNLPSTLRKAQGAEHKLRTRKGFCYFGKLLLENMTGQVVKLSHTGEKDVALELALNHTVQGLSLTGKLLLQKQ